MYKTIALSTAIAMTALAGAANAASDGKSSLTEEKVVQLKTAWGEGIVKIGKAHTKGKDYRAAAEAHIKQFYAFGDRPVLFKPTLASEDQFRGTFEEAMSYFVGGGMKEDTGFAIVPYTAVRWEKEGTIISGNTAMTMGNYYFKKADGAEVKVEYTFGIEQMENGEAKIVLHHSSIPFSPQS